MRDEADTTTGGLRFEMAPEHIFAALAAIKDDGSTTPTFSYDYETKRFTVTLPGVALETDNGDMEVVGHGGTPDEGLANLWQLFASQNATLTINGHSVKRRRIVRWDRFVWRFSKPTRAEPPLQSCG